MSDSKWLATTHPRARKTHWCSLCTGKILIGQTYYRTSSAYDGTVGNWKSCEECAADRIESRVLNWITGPYDYPGEGISTEDVAEWAKNAASPAHDCGPAMDCLPAKRLLDRARNRG